MKGKWRVTSRGDSAGFGGVGSAQGQGHTGKSSRFCPINHLIYTLQLLHGQETSLHFIGEATVRWHREGRQLAQGHTATEQQGESLSPCPKWTPDIYGRSPPFSESQLSHM